MHKEIFDNKTLIFTTAVILLIALLLTDKLYKSLIGTFSHFKKNSDLPVVTNIYKTNEKYLLYDDYYVNVLVANYDDKNDKFVNIKNIKNKIGSFTHTLQLNNGKILFYYLSENSLKKRLIFTIYDIDKDVIADKLIHKDSVNHWELKNLWAIDKDSFAFLIDKNKNEKTEEQELYIYKNGKIKRIKNTFVKNVGYKSVIRFNNNIFGFRYSTVLNNGNLFIYKFNPKDNSFKQIDITSIIKTLEELNDNKHIPERGIFVLSDNRFLVIHDVGNDKFLSLFRIDKDKIEKIYTKNCGKSSFLLNTAVFGELNRDKILIIGGYNGNPMFPKYTKRVYRFNLETAKLTRLNDTCGSSDSILKLNENKIILIDKQKLFKKGILW